jgi:hypothetical protein
MFRFISEREHPDFLACRFPPATIVNVSNKPGRSDPQVTFYFHMQTRTKLPVFIAVAVTVALASYSVAVDAPQTAAKPIDAKADATPKVEAPTPEKFGVLQNDSRAFPGYNLINPAGKSAYLYDNEGRVVHTWRSEYTGQKLPYHLQ